MSPDFCYCLEKLIHFNKFRNVYRIYLNSRNYFTSYPLSYLSTMYSKTNLQNPWVWGIPAVALILFGLIIVTNSNVAVFLAINSLHHITGNGLWANLTIIGDTLVIFSLVFPLIKRYPSIVWAAIISGVLGGLWVHIMKSVFESNRPAAELALDTFNIIGPLLKYFSFPSGHTTSAFALAAVIALYTPYLGLRLGVVFIAILAGLARIVVGAHWPVDVLGGMFGGWLAGVFGVLLAQRWKWGTSLKAQRMTGLILCLCPLLLLFQHNTHYPQALPLQYTIGIVSLIVGGYHLWRLFFPPNPAL